MLTNSKMALVYSCVSPHGGELIPKLASSDRIAKRFDRTRAGMRKITRDLRKVHPQTIVIASPHNLRLLRHLSVVVSENSSGKLEGRRGVSVSLHAKCDVEVANEILKVSERHRLPAVGANYGTFEGPSSDLAMDWGTLVPLWFFGKRAPRPKVVIVSPSREISLHENFAFGQVIANVAKKSKKRIAFVASADQAHAHSKRGPYGFHESAKTYDSIVQEAIIHNQLSTLLHIDRKVVDEAKPDSLWQLSVLAGVLSKVPSTSVLYSYQVPTYYGMICAGFFPRADDDR